MVVLSMCGAAWGANKYATFDSDGGDGTIGNPYTIAEAATNCAGNTIYLGAGTYTLAADLTIAGASTWIAQGAVVIDGVATKGDVYVQYIYR